MKTNFIAIQPTRGKLKMKDGENFISYHGIPMVKDKKWRCSLNGNYRFTGHDNREITVCFMEVSDVLRPSFFYRILRRIFIGERWRQVKEDN